MCGPRDRRDDGPCHPDVKGARDTHVGSRARYGEGGAAGPHARVDYADPRVSGCDAGAGASRDRPGSGLDGARAVATAGTGTTPAVGPMGPRATAPHRGPRAPPSQSPSLTTTRTPRALMVVSPSNDKAPLSWRLRRLRGHLITKPSQVAIPHNAFALRNEQAVKPIYHCLEHKRHCFIELFEICHSTAPRGPAKRNEFCMIVVFFPAAPPACAGRADCI